MKKTIKGAEYAYHSLKPYQASWPTVVCLHGFTGTSATFNQSLKTTAKINFLTIDLIGHGNSAVYVHPYRYQMPTLIRDLEDLMKELAIPDYFLLGYSMGGRVALAWALTFPENKLGIMLESASPGLKILPKRIARKKSDRKLALRLEQYGIENFVDFWQELPLFASQKNLAPEIQARVRQERLQQAPFGLAMSLLFMGTGSQASYWTVLKKTDIPILFLAGQLDLKFSQIGLQMAQQAKNFAYQVIPAAGHCIHLEQPEKFQQAVLSWLADQKE
ncbi:2-succinyl-6-hydroxy-2,4-cyclohexadiene-1-carboxylate synthase [Enterococcus sp. HY326]|uniref:2-succinyl-6-hydroxy-2, 4-cyclohexadiene-1-carboxylate synthase n=1 Tax=Enterococcus sp. HY326 TaxID=2971265 RepID=UPI00223FC1E3|nr:2-succinyl-6-hydroxy-2,4-cyclohexadiene-1-carboxylate synthase [Enterococcus sp. HY326]